MNSVAGSKVATMMNSNFSALKTNANSGKSTNDFSQVFKQVNSNNRSYRGDQDSVNRSEQAIDHRETALVETEVTKKPLMSDKSANNKSVAEKMKEVTEEVVSEVTEVKAVKTETPIEEIDEIYTEALIAISEMFHMPIEELQSFLDEKGFNLIELSDASNLVELVQSIFGHQDMGAMLLDAEATETLKAVRDEVQTFVQNLGENFDMDSLRDQLAAFSNNGGVQAIQVVDQPIGQIVDPIISQEGEMTMTNGPEMEINDLREAGPDTTKYSQNNSNGQEQNNQTFGELVSEQITTLKEVVGTGELDKPDFQQISTREVIDQIVTKAIINLSNEKTTMQLQLNPGHLGKVAVSVTAEQGVVKGQFIAENTVVKEMLETNMIQLKTQLEEQGIKVDKIEVTVGNANQYFEQRQQGNKQNQEGNKPKSNKIGRINRLMEVDNLETIEQAVQEPTSTLGDDAYTVEYSA